MRMVMIAVLAAGVALPAQAQVKVGRGSATAVRTGGQWGGGFQGQRQMQSQWQGQRQAIRGNWGGRQFQQQRQSQFQRQGQVQGQRFGGDPRTWGPGSQPGPRNGGQWHRGGNWQGGNWQGGNRWGGYIGGRWSGGWNAPGGWDAYRRPHRGWALPGYWRQPAWAINDWQVYGLGAPPIGYSWSRYYDDAVLLDGNGYVYDTVSDLDWQRYDQPYPTGYGYPGQGYYNGADGYDPRCYQRRKGSGVGGAVIGGAIGAGIGAATGGLGSTLIGGGVGALAGRTIDRESRGQQIICDDGPGYYDNGPVPGAPGVTYGGGGGYAEAGDGYAYAQGGGGGSGVVYAAPQPVIQPIYGYQSYGYAPGVSATATVEFGVPVTTTTTTTTVTEEYVSGGRVVHRKRRAPSKVICRC